MLNLGIEIYAESLLIEPEKENKYFMADHGFLFVIFQGPISLFVGRKITVN